ncbi:MAG: S8 family peptidase [Candidatus Altiarchaeota archaeon]|nr:S8 family peptidase [Candidatus Altiarchaeota archaeon]
MKKLSIVLIFMFLAVPVMADRYYVKTDSKLVHAMFGSVHNFPGAFSTELTRGQLKALDILGIETEAVGLFSITKPFCNNNGICESDLGENPSCLDCKSGDEPIPDERTCYPSDQYPWGIERVNGGLGGTGVVVAVLDTGVDKDHPDLSNNILDCVSKVTHFPPDKRNCDDPHGHGTHVAGTILANGGADNLGIYGVAPEAKLIAVKVCDRRGYCYGDDMASGIYYATDSGAEIISMSIGGNTPDSQVLSAIDYAVFNGVMVIAAAGNDGPADGSIDYPGAYYKVIAVGATDSSDNVPYWSSRGINDGDYLVEEREVEFAAPGVSIYSALNDGCYGLMDGTSMATPHISGLAAKLWQGSALSTRNYLHSSSLDIGTTGDDTATGFGLPSAP